MSTRTVDLVAELHPPQTVVGLPPSDLDPAPDKLRVAVNGSLITRDYDPTMVQP